MDDATIAVMEEPVLSDLRTLKTRLDDIGLKNNDFNSGVTLLHHISD